MRFKGLDLNLIVTLSVLLEERSVSAAARRLHLSQPATSAALGRLRSFFDDAILITLGKSMYPTPFAESLRPQLREFLRAAEDIITVSSTFEPGSSQRTFTVVASDSVISSLFVPLLDRLSVEAPSVGFDFIFPGPSSQTQFNRGDVDLMISPEGFVGGDHPTELLFEEQHVVVGWRDNPVFAEAVTEEAFFARPHVVVAIGPSRTLSFADRQVERLGRSRRIEVAVPAFSMAPPLLVGTDRLALMHERLAVTMARQLPIAYTPLPFALPPLRQMLHHHGSRTHDDGVRWLADELRKQASSIHSVDGMA